MKFASVVFRIAAVWGVLVLTPLYFMANRLATCRARPARSSMSGFLAVMMAWQLAFWVIGSDPARFRLMILPAIVEKFAYAATLAILGSTSRIVATGVMRAIPDVILAVLFIAAFLRTSPRARS